MRATSGGAAPDFGSETPREEARRALARAFSAAAIESAELDARVLLCAALGIDHAGLIADPDRPLGEGAERVGAFASRRLRREPVSRILGHKEFWGERFEIDSAVLDPRPDTETLVEAVLDHVARGVRSDWRILDLGVGSGAILCALLRSLPMSFGVGVDISPKACVIARRNLEALGLARRGAIVCGDWTSALRGRFDLIVSNPPYIGRGEILELAPEVRIYDPSLALDGGDDGLAAYRQIIPALAPLLAPSGAMAFELGTGQREAVGDLLRGAGLVAVDVRRDLAGRERVILAKISGERGPQAKCDKSATALGRMEIFSKRVLAFQGKAARFPIQGRPFGFRCGAALGVEILLSTQTSRGWTIQGDVRFRLHKTLGATEVNVPKLLDLRIGGRRSVPRQFRVHSRQRLESLQPARAFVFLKQWFDKSRERHAEPALLAGRDYDATQGSSMRPGQNNKRMRGRPNSNRKGPNPLTRSYESSGPDVKIRGTAHHIGEKYLQLARDAQSAGDPVTAESYLQHAEHYFRLIAVAQQAQQQSMSGYQRQPGDAVAEEIDDGDDFTGIPDRFASPPERFASPPQPAFAPPPNIASQQPNPDRSFYGNPDKQTFERPERAPRQERPFQDKGYQERSYPERGGSGRDQESRGQRPARGPRDYRGDGAPRGDQRGESRAPVEEVERKGLPAFITAPITAPARVQAEALGANSPVESLSTVLVDPPEAEHEVNGFHLRPRRRRRSKAEMAIDQASPNEATTATDRVGD